MRKKGIILACVLLAAGTVTVFLKVSTGSSSRNTPESSSKRETSTIRGDTQTINSGHTSKINQVKLAAQPKSDILKEDSTKPTINDSVVDGVKKLLLFVGHERSYHSFTGSLIDAHPHTILATKYNPLWKYYDQPQRFPTKKEFFNILADYASQRDGPRYNLKAEAKGYSLIVDPRYQGIFEGDLQVIGSQRANTVSYLYRKYPNEFETLISHIKEVVGIPVYFIRVIRNPYDIIATRAGYQEMSKEKFVELKAQLQLNGTLKTRHKIDKVRLNRLAVDHFSVMEATVGVLKTSDKYLDVYCDRPIAHSKKVISDMCKFLEVECSRDYIDTCASKVFTEESSTRKIIEWPEDILQYIKTVGSKFPTLSHYISAGVD